MGAARPKLDPQHVRQLKEGSGLSDDTLRASGLYSESDPERIALILGWEKPYRSYGSCLVFTYWLATGEPSSYKRIRPDNPRPDPEKPGEFVKYESPVGQGNRAYFPPAARAAIATPGASLAIVEGEKKALAADQHGIPCIGISRVWSWARTDEQSRTRLISDLEGIDWRGRKIILVPDSDAVENHNVQAAMHKLAEVLTATAEQQAEAAAKSEFQAKSEPQAKPVPVSPPPPPAPAAKGKGAKQQAAAKPAAPKSHTPTICQPFLPAGGNGEKVGLDDFLKVAGRAGWDKLVRTAGPPPMPHGEFELSNGFRYSVEGGELPRPIGHVFRRMLKMTDGWPKRCGGQLFVPAPDGRPLYLRNQSGLFAWLGGEIAKRSGAARSAISWTDRGTGFASKGEMFEYAGQRAPFVDAVEVFPHHPAVPGLRIEYMHPPLPKSNGAAIKALIEQFSPASKEDRSLIGAFFMTLVWGGPTGARPAFLFTTDDDSPAAGRGAGKSTVLNMASLLLENRTVSIEDGADFDTVKTRLLSPEASGARILALDNLKSLRFSWAEMEGLITMPTVSGRQLYRGEGKRPNLFTVVLTLNGASLSKDMAQRVIPVHLRRADYSGKWLRDTLALVEGRRWEILADLVGLLQRPPTTTLKKFGRWATWEQDVLSRLADAALLQTTIATRQRDVDDDAAKAAMVSDAVEQLLRRYDHDPRSAVVRLPLDEITRVANRVTGGHMIPDVASKWLATLGVPHMSPKRSNSVRYWLWQGEDASDAQEPVALVPEPYRYAGRGQRSRADLA